MRAAPRTTASARIGGPRRRHVISLIKEYWEFLKTEKKRWMVVLVVLLLLVGALVTFTSSAVAPFIYALF